ncbi:MAG: hypothetical protein KIS88_05350 [Anaerolineales bacterium]|nr:hypothetical protein [Anaerolineales bacterium]
MQKNSSWRALEQFLIPALALAVLLVYTYVRFFALPYVGLQYSPVGEVVEVYGRVGEVVQKGDRLLEVNGLRYEDHLADLMTPLFEGVRPGDLIQLRVEGSTGERSVEYRAPGFNFPEFGTRFFNTWWLSFIFWITGTIIFFHVRPRDVRWRLLVASNYLTAIWLIAGALSLTTIFMSPLVFRTAIWVCVPVYLHLHWNFPQPFPKLPRPVWYLLYGVGIGFAILQLVNVVPEDWYAFAFALTIITSLILLLVRLMRSVDERREVGLLLGAFALALIPSAVLGLATTQPAMESLGVGAVISLVAWPGAYFYVVYRRQLGGLELRANRLISVYLFFLFLFTLSLIMVSVFAPLIEDPHEIVLAVLFTGLLVSLFSVFAFERFQRFVERRLLNIPLPPEGLQQGFANRISTSFTRQHLGQTLQRDVLPGLLIRKSALLHFEARSQERQVIYLQGVELDELPDAQGQQRLLQLGSRPGEDGLPEWIQLSIPVRTGSDLVGLWLLGRKDPDDYYSYLEERMLHSLADQMAIALVNIQQADLLRVLHQRDIDFQEERGAFLARELHDDVLAGINELVSLAQRGDELALLNRREQLSETVRQLIYRLRPAMLDFGLYRALTELTDMLTQRLGEEVQVSLMVPESHQMYEGHVAEHAYRIVQQAAENAIRHAKPQYINISGQLEADRFDLLIEDDGVGFDMQSSSLPDLLRAQHFGLASMNERAALIGAYLFVHSVPQQGTQVRLQWKKE